MNRKEEPKIYEGNVRVIERIGKTDATYHFGWVKVEIKKVGNNV